MININKIGNTMIDTFHYVALFVIGATVIWSASYEYMQIMQKSHAELKDILLLFIYLEIGAMVGIYFKTKKLPLYFLIFIAITALARHLIVDLQEVKNSFDLYLIATIVVSIFILSISLWFLLVKIDNKILD